MLSRDGSQECALGADCSDGHAVVFGFLGEKCSGI